MLGDILVTDVTPVTGVTDVTGVTGVTDVTGVTGVTDVTGVTAVTDVTGETDFFLTQQGRFIEEILKYFGNMPY